MIHFLVSKTKKETPEVAKRAQSTAMIEVMQIEEEPVIMSTEDKPSIDQPTGMTKNCAVS